MPPPIGDPVVRTDGHVTITSLRKLFCLIGYQICLAVVLHYKVMNWKHTVSLAPHNKIRKRISWGRGGKVISLLRDLMTDWSGSGPEQRLRAKISELIMLLATCYYFCQKRWVAGWVGGGGGSRVTFFQGAILYFKLVPSRFHLQST